MSEMNADDVISGLMMRHVASELRNYHGNLTSAVHIVSQGWLPDSGNPGVAEHVETLRNYLAEIGTVEDDSFLLRLGLTTPGMQRGIIPPFMVLEPNRGGFSNRRQQEAAGTVSRLREALALGRQFLPSLNPESETAISELAEITQRQARPDDGEWLELYGRLSNDEADTLAARAIVCLESDQKPISEVGERALQYLTCFRQSPLSVDICLNLVERGVLAPSSLYRESGEWTAEQIVKSIEEAENRASLTVRLLALAWTRTDIAEQSFRYWTKRPPEWAEDLHLPPAEYTTTAG